jgi:hypothetical protein
LHPIETKIHEYLNNLPKDSLSLKLQAAIFADKLEKDLVSKFLPREEEQFRLRMSNIGLPLRQLCLQRDHGFKGKSGSFTLNTFYGTMLESLLLFLLTASGCNIQSVNEAVELKVDDFTLKGELDVIIDGAVYDIKSASNYAYNNKFSSLEALQSDDSFGYVTQGFGYALAKSLPFGGWIVINKEKGIFKVLAIPLLASVQTPLKRASLTDIEAKIDHVVRKKLPAPECDKEFFNRKPTGKLILNRNCEWCNYKDGICHKKLEYKACEQSEAKDPPMRYYVQS